MVAYNPVQMVAQAGVNWWMLKGRGMQQRISREAVLTDGGESFFLLGILAYRRRFLLPAAAPPQIFKKYSVLDNSSKIL